jgi:hypothetical protein
MTQMPARNHSSAPSFKKSDTPRELRRYFEELDHLLKANSIVDDDEKKSYARRYVDIDTSDLWETIPEHKAASSYQQFVEALYKLYPGSDNERRWALTDMDALIGEHARLGIYTLAELGTYYRSFITITTFLIDKGRLSENEQSRAFTRGFPSSLWNRVQQRLQLKNPDHYPDDPYTLNDINEAAKFVLSGTDQTPPPSNNANVETVASTRSQPAQQPSTSQNVIKSEDFAAIMERFAQTIASSLRQNDAPTQHSQQQRRNNNNHDRCNFCNLTGHFVYDCPEVVIYLNAGKIKKNIEGRITLPTSAYIPRSIEGVCMKDRVDEWHRRNPGQTAATQPTSNTNPVPQMIYAISPASAPSPAVSSYQLSTDERIIALEQEIYALRSGRTLDNNAEPKRILKRQMPPRRAPDVPTAPSTNNTNPNPIPATQQESSSANQERSNVDEGPIHPFRNVKETNYAPPKDRNYGSPPKPAKEKDTAYTTQVPIHNDKVADVVYERSMKAPCITLSQEELLSLSPEVRQKIRDSVTPRRIANNAVRTHAYVEDPLPFSEESATFTISKNDHTPPADAIVVDDPYEVYLNNLLPGEEDTFIVAKESSAIRALSMTVDNQADVDSILDAGSQIVAMSRSVCHSLGITYDPTVRLNMQSANGEIDQSLGLARNVPCRLKDITLYLQFHVVISPAYDILLGKPFDVLTESTVKTYRNEDMTITITDPNSGKVATIPTFPRGPPKFCDNSDCPNFRSSTRTATTR